MKPPEALSDALGAVERLLAEHTPVAGSRTLVGIAGPPGAGKSTLAAALAKALSRTVPAVVVPMDGFHLANAELRRLGLAERKGAPQTFDAAGFVHLLRRLRTPGREVVYAPTYSRTLHESIGGAIPVPAEVRVVIVEGNYLLLDDEPWSQVRDLLDLACYLEAPGAARRDALVHRQRARGLDRQAARAWVRDSDEVNARLVAGTRDRAGLVLRRG